MKPVFHVKLTSRCFDLSDVRVDEHFSNVKSIFFSGVSHVRNLPISLDEISFYRGTNCEINLRITVVGKQNDHLPLLFSKISRLRLKVGQRD